MAADARSVRVRAGLAQRNADAEMILCGKSEGNSHRTARVGSRRDNQNQRASEIATSAASLRQVRQCR